MQVRACGSSLAGQKPADDHCQYLASLFAIKQGLLLRWKVLGEKQEPAACLVAQLDVRVVTCAE
jgi:hypothetical protein